MPTSENLRKTSVQLWVNLGSLPKTLEIFLFSRSKVKVNIASSTSIGAHGGRFDDGEEVSSPFSWGGSRVVRYRGVIKEKSPDFTSPEVGISAHGIESFKIVSKS